MSRPCYCDDACTLYRDCCADFQWVCSAYSADPFSRRLSLTYGAAQPVAAATALPLCAVKYNVADEEWPQTQGVMTVEPENMARNMHSASSDALPCQLTAASSDYAIVPCDDCLYPLSVIPLAGSGDHASVNLPPWPVQLQEGGPFLQWVPPTSCLHLGCNVLAWSVVEAPPSLLPLLPHKCFHIPRIPGAGPFRGRPVTPATTTQTLTHAPATATTRARCTRYLALWACSLWSRCA